MRISMPNPIGGGDHPDPLIKLIGWVGTQDEDFYKVTEFLHNFSKVCCWPCFFVLFVLFLFVCAVCCLCLF